MQVWNGTVGTCWALLKVVLGLRTSHLYTVVLISCLCCGSSWALNSVAMVLIFLSV